MLTRSDISCISLVRRPVSLVLLSRRCTVALVTGSDCFSITCSCINGCSPPPGPPRYCTMWGRRRRSSDGWGGVCEVWGVRVVYSGNSSQTDGWGGVCVCDVWGVCEVWGSNRWVRGSVCVRCEVWGWVLFSDRWVRVVCVCVWGVRVTLLRQMGEGNVWQHCIPCTKLHCTLSVYS